MSLSSQEVSYLIEEIRIELNAKPDGGKKNLIAPVCPYCNKGGGKYGIYIGKETERKRPFMAHCFSCGHSTFTLEQLLSDINRRDLIPSQTASLSGQLEPAILFPFLQEEEDEIDDSLFVSGLPDHYKRSFSHAYLKTRGFTYDDYDYFPVGTTSELNFRYLNYVIFPVFDNNDIVGFVARHCWSKEEIDTYNRKAKIKGGFQIPRFRNSTENDFVKLLYNYDNIIEDVTDTVVLVEGVFDVIALTRKLNLYDNHNVAVVATFGKKISPIQIYKLQSKGIRTVIIGYDGDAVDHIKKIADLLHTYFEVFIADISDPEKDWEDLSYGEIFEIFSEQLKTPIEYKLNKIQEKKYGRIN